MLLARARELQAIQPTLAELVVLLLGRRIAAPQSEERPRTGSQPLKVRRLALAAPALVLATKAALAKAVGALAKVAVALARVVAALARIAPMVMLAWEATALEVTALEATAVEAMALRVFVVATQAVTASR